MTQVETETGHHWRCNGCPFRSGDAGEARAHVERAEAEYRAGRAPWRHACYEVLADEPSTFGWTGAARRRIYATPGGELRLGQGGRGKRARAA